jgi:hypothetical protein
MLLYRDWGFQCWTWPKLGQPMIDTVTFENPVKLHWLKGGMSLCPPINPYLAPALRTVLVCIGAPELAAPPSDPVSSVPAGQIDNAGISNNYWSEIINQWGYQVANVPLRAKWPKEPVSLPGKSVNLYVFPQAVTWANNQATFITDPANAPNFEMQAVLCYEE